MFLQPCSSEGSTPATSFKSQDGPFIFSNTCNYQLACDGAAGASAASGVGMPAVSSGNALFTAAQWQELERQTEICKYIMACVPVPPQLLWAYHSNLSRALGPASHSSTSTSELRFSSGTDLQPWRCRRTDGKKWRCSRDVAPDHKYCERHAHKSRPRSRKHVEIQPHTSAIYCPQQPTAHFPTTGSIGSYDQYRVVEWFSNGDGCTSLDNQHRQLLLQSSSRAQINRNSWKHNKEECIFQHRYKDKLEPMTFIPYIDRENHQLNGPYWNSFLETKSASSLQGNMDAHTTQTTRHFIDAWSTPEKGLDKFSSKGCGSYATKLPPSSLTLSIPGGNDIDEDNEHANLGLRTLMNSERKNSEEIIKTQWMNPVSWMSSAPGGPLGEALFLGAANGAKLASNLPSSHGYSSITTASSCSRSSYEDGARDLNFLG